MFPSASDDCNVDDDSGGTSNGDSDGTSDGDSDGTTDCSVVETYVNGSWEQFYYWVGESTSELQLDSGFD